MLGLKNLAVFPSYFDYIFVHLKQKARLRPDLNPKFLSTSGPNPTWKARPDLQLWVTLLRGLIRRFTIIFCLVASSRSNKFSSVEVNLQLSSILPTAKLVWIRLKNRPPSLFRTGWERCIKQQQLFVSFIFCFSFSIFNFCFENGPKNASRKSSIHSMQSCKSARVFRVGFGPD